MLLDIMHLCVLHVRVRSNECLQIVCVFRYVCTNACMYVVIFVIFVCIICMYEIM